MYDSSGTGMGTLDVKYSSDGSTWTSFVTKSGNQGRQVIYKEIVALVRHLLIIALTECVALYPANSNPADRPDPTSTCLINPPTYPSKATRGNNSALQTTGGILAMVPDTSSSITRQMIATGGTQQSTKSTFTRVCINACPGPLRASFPAMQRRAISTHPAPLSVQTLRDLMRSDATPAAMYSITPYTPAASYAQQCMLPSTAACSGTKRDLNLIGETPIDDLVTTGSYIRPAFVGEDCAIHDRDHVSDRLQTTQPPNHP